MAWNRPHPGGDVRASDLGVPDNALELIVRGRRTEVESFGRGVQWPGSAPEVRKDRG